MSGRHRQERGRDSVRRFDTTRQNGHFRNGRSYESNGPKGRIRGTAIQIAEVYIIAARDAMNTGDMVAAEGCYQHAEHYFRVLAESEAPGPAQQP